MDLRAGAAGVLSMAGPALIPAGYFLSRYPHREQDGVHRDAKESVIEGVKADMLPSPSQPHPGHMARER